MQRAHWVPAVAMALGLTALACLAVAVSWWIALVVLLARLANGPSMWLSSTPQGRLSVQDPDNSWLFEHSNGSLHVLALRHVWHGPVWSTLEFHASPCGKALELTVWRSTVSSTGWRRLRRLASRGPQGPRLRITEGQ